MILSRGLYIKDTMSHWKDAIKLFSPQMKPDYQKGWNCWFFGVDYINRKNEVVLIHCGIRYNAQIIVKNDSSNRANLNGIKI